MGRLGVLCKETLRTRDKMIHDVCDGSCCYYFKISLRSSPSLYINNRKKSTKLSVEYCHLISKCIGNRAVRGEWRGLALGSLCYGGKIMKFKE